MHVFVPLYYIYCNTLNIQVPQSRGNAQRRKTLSTVTGRHGWAGTFLVFTPQNFQDLCPLNISYYTYLFDPYLTSKIPPWPPHPHPNCDLQPEEATGAHLRNAKVCLPYEMPVVLPTHGHWGSHGRRRRRGSQCAPGRMSCAGFVVWDVCQAMNLATNEWKQMEKEHGWGVVRMTESREGSRGKEEGARNHENEHISQSTHPPCPAIVAQKKIKTFKQILDFHYGADWAKQRSRMGDIYVQSMQGSTPADLCINLVWEDGKTSGWEQ